MQNHLKALYARHGIIEAKIHGEQCRPSPDSLRVRALKKMKLKLRDQIRTLERQLVSGQWVRGSESQPPAV